MNLFKKVFATMIATLMSLFMVAMPVMADDETPTPAPTPSATIDTSIKGSITVTKYKDNPASTGTQNLTGTTADDPNKLEAVVQGVEFTLYQVENAQFVMDYYNGTTTKTAVTVADYVTSVDANGTIKENGWLEGTEPIVKTTDKDGKIKFNDLPVGMYVLIETGDANNIKIDTKCIPTLISIPMAQKAQTVGTATVWNYDVYVYPKNETTDAALQIIKHLDKVNGTALAGATFNIYDENNQLVKFTEDNGVYSVNADGTVTDLVTDSTGKIAMKNFDNGTYYAMEKALPTDSKYIADTEEQYVFKVEGLVVSFPKVGEQTFEQAHTKNGLSSAVATIAPTEGDPAPAKIDVANFKPAIKKNVLKKGTTTWQDCADWSIGDQVEYKVSITVPQNIDQLQTFVVTDVPTNAKFVPDSITTDSQITTEMITNKGAKDNGYEIVFKPSKMAGVAGKVITFTYKAELLDEAVVTTVGNPNTVTLNYSNNTTNETTDSTNKLYDKTVVYTFEVDLTKQLQGKTNADSLAGIEFELYQGSQIISFTKDANSSTYTKVDSTVTTGSVTTLTTDADGKIYIKGLSDGDYALKEIKTAKNYNLLSKPYEFKLNATYETGEDTSTNYYAATSAFGKGSDSIDISSDVGTITVVNKKGFDLPLTGGFGLISFTFGGLLLIAGGFLLLKNTKKA